MKTACNQGTETVASPPWDLRRLMTEYQSPLLRYVVQLLWPDETGSQDVVQTTFLRCHRYLEEHGHEALANPKAWLFRVAHNLSMDNLRGRRRRQELENRIQDDPAVIPEPTGDLQQLERRELFDLALCELQRLPEEQKQVLLLKHIQGLTLREISEITGMNIGTVNYRLTQGLSTLASKLKAEVAGGAKQIVATANPPQDPAMSAGEGR